MGIESAMVQVPQGLARRALTTTSATAASRIIMMASTANSATIPLSLLTSSRAICPRDLPSRRMEAASTVKSCTQPPSTAPTMSQRVPGR